MIIHGNFRKNNPELPKRYSHHFMHAHKETEKYYTVRVTVRKIKMDKLIKIKKSECLIVRS